MRPNKHIIPILLALILALPVVSILGLSGHERNVIRKEIKHRMIEGIDREELVLLTFKKSEVDQLVRWEHSGEFEFQKTMYDIVEVQEDGDMIHYWCWWDRKETRLNKKLYSLLNAYLSTNKEEQNKKCMVGQFFKTLFSQPSRDVHFTNERKDLKFPPLLISYTSNEVPTTSPPPING